MNNTTQPVIRFYRLADEHGYLSNFAPFPIDLEGKLWPTTEHYGGDGNGKNMLGIILMQIRQELKPQ